MTFLSNLIWSRTSSCGLIISRVPNVPFYEKRLVNPSMSGVCCWQTLAPGISPHCRTSNNAPEASKETGKAWSWCKMQTVLPPSPLIFRSRKGRRSKEYSNDFISQGSHSPEASVPAYQMLAHSRCLGARLPTSRMIDCGDWGRWEL